MMKLLFTIALSIITLTGYAQDRYKPFHKADYPVRKYAIKVDTFAFNNFKIELVHAKLRDYSTYDSLATYCRIWLNVKLGNKMIDSLFINSCESVGGCSGIHASKDQRSKDYFILSKFGDYDGQLILINKSGKIKTYLGGIYFLSNDNRYLFSQYDSDLSGLTVYDLAKHKVLFSDTIPYYLKEFYVNNNSYFAEILDENENEEEAENESVKNKIDIAAFDFNKKKLIVSSVDEGFIKTSRKLTLYNGYEQIPCNCAQSENKK